jgi:hypothetical protein
MAYGDPRYTHQFGGSTVTSAAGAHLLFGNYTGLSLLNSNEVVNVLVSACAGDFRLSLNPSIAATNDSSLRIFSAASVFDLPPLSVGEASMITFAREGANNPVAFWTILKRVP